jgi:AcrR family transcriptional regulator
VSPRTIGNYFAGKQELIAAIGADRAARIAETLSARPAGEPLWDALEHTLLAQFAERSEVTRANVAASVATPALRAARLELDRSLEPVLARAVAERSGTDPDRDLYPRLVAGAVVSLTRVAIDHWLASEDPELSLPGLLREALRQVSQGLPVPEGQQ